MDRRDLLRAFGSATALAILPIDTLAAWSRVATGIQPSSGLSDAQLALVGALSDTILPRTDTPSATDVGVPAFVNVIVAENYTDADRAAVLSGLDAIDARAIAEAGAPLSKLSNDARARLIESIESSSDRRSEPSRTYWRLKGLIVHGYFTSERVMKDVLHVEVMPGRFDGSAPVTIERARPTGSGIHG
jgi:hypothetical protein